MRAKGSTSQMKTWIKLKYQIQTPTESFKNKIFLIKLPLTLTKTPNSKCPSLLK